MQKTTTSMILPPSPQSNVFMHLYVIWISSLNKKKKTKKEKKNKGLRAITYYGHFDQVYV